MFVSGLSGIERFNFKRGPRVLEGAMRGEIVHGIANFART